MDNDQHPFEKIALTLSGGGTRAVGFHLGTLAYLDRLKLLEKVGILSTVSGGSVVGMGYAVYTKEGKSFQELYRDLQSAIPQTPMQLVDLLQAAIEQGNPAPSGRKTLIGVMAEVYNKIFKFCDDKRLELFGSNNEIHLKEIIFNATEFRTGVGFRFHQSDKDLPSGSDFAPLPKKYACQARMADILASSTCIPVGFEPIAFPQDFHWPDDEPSGRGKMRRPTCDKICSGLPSDATSSDEQKTSVALMDGGVYDNQGIFSVLRLLGLTYDTKADRQHDSSEGYTPRDDGLRPMLGAGTEADNANLDLFIVSDTPLREEPIYEIGAHPVSDGFLDLSKIKWMAGVAATLLLCSTLFLGYRFIANLLVTNRLAHWQNIVVDIFALVVPLVLLLACVGGYFYLSSRLKRYLDHSAAFINNRGLKEKLWNLVKKRKFDDLGYMIQSRLGSALAMSSDVFMNRIRFLGYARLLNIAGLKNKTVINVIDTVVRDKAGQETVGGRATGESHLKSELLEGINPFSIDTFVNASKTPTLFWLAKKDWQNLIACGQATMCYNLLKHMEQMKKFGRPAVKSGRFKKLYDLAESDWQKLKSDAFYLVDNPYLDLT